MKIIGTTIMLACLAASALPVLAQPGPGFELVGKIKPRSASEIVAAGQSNTFGIGGETTDRGFSTYENWRDYLGPLGATKVRIQTGWHFIEKTITTPATYDFSKVDSIVDGVRSQGVQPFVFLGYGNEQAGCTNCGTKGLGGALPVGAGRQKWLDFVRATVTRYNQPTVRVRDWEIWNEPDGHVSATEYAQLAVQTAQLIKSIQPSAKITIGSFTTGVLNNPGTPGHTYAKTVVDYFADNKGATVPNGDVSVAYHPYWGLPDYDSYPSMQSKFDAFKTLVEARGFKIRQGENGAPSTECQYFALCGGTPFDEVNQAKYMLRRMLGDFARGIETNIFTITDLHYDSTKNTKGLLRTGTWQYNPNPATGFKNGDQTVKGKKIAYGSYQNVTAIFDNRLQRITNHGCTAPWGHTVHAYQRNDAGILRTMLVVWKKTTELPTASAGVTPIDISCNGFHFSRFAQSATLRPRFADLLDGSVYQLTSSTTIQANSASSNSVLLKNIPVGDYPVVIADQGIVVFQ